MIRSYRELKQLKTFDERFEYLSLRGYVGQETFGYDRYLNQMLYSSPRWKRTRDGIIVRDSGLDLGVVGYDIHTQIVIHHMNPITIEDIEEDNDDIFNPEFLITTTARTHKAIHYGGNHEYQPIIERRKNDTCPWRQMKGV